MARAGFYRSERRREGWRDGGGGGEGGEPGHTQREEGAIAWGQKITAITGAAGEEAEGFFLFYHLSSASSTRRVNNMDTSRGRE